MPVSRPAGTFPFVKFPHKISHNACALSAQSQESAKRVPSLSLFIRSVVTVGVSKSEGGEREEVNWKKTELSSSALGEEFKSFGYCNYKAEGRRGEAA